MAEEDIPNVAEEGEDLREDASIFDPQGAMHPDHPLLLRAQEALKNQLLKAKTTLEEEVREKERSLKVIEKQKHSQFPPSLQNCVDKKILS